MKTRDAPKIRFDRILTIFRFGSAEAVAEAAVVAEAA